MVFGAIHSSAFAPFSRFPAHGTMLPFDTAGAPVQLMCSSLASKHGCPFEEGHSTPPARKTKHSPASASFHVQDLPPKTKAVWFG